MIRFLVVIAVALFAAGCEGTENEGPGLGLLDGTHWRLISWVDESLDPSAYNITADFDEREIMGTSGVNRYAASYTAGDDHSFSIGELRSTLMAGAPDAMRAEAHYLRLLREAREFAMTGDRLILRSGGRDILTFSAR